MEHTELVEITAIDQNENGAGIGKLDGMAVFVPGLMTGETARIKIVSREKNYAMGECVTRLTDSPNRMKPICPCASLCGGCTLAHMTWEAENKTKRNAVRSALRRNGLPYELVEETVHGENRTEYRNKLTVHRTEYGYGLYKSGTHEGIPFEGCLICPGIMSDIVSFSGKHLTEAEQLTIRTVHDGSVTVTVDGESNDSYRTALAEAFPGVKAVYFPKKGRSEGVIRDEIGGISMEFSTEAFRQVNSEAFSMLLELVRSVAASHPFSYGADLYCGSGLIGLTLAKAFPDASFYGIEINADAVRDAKNNARDNGIGNIRFFCGDAASFREKIPKKELPQMVVVDPPRAGLSPSMTKGLLELCPERVIYVSCNPQTMARDLKKLSEQYDIRRVVPVNMFPMTKHVEAVCLLSKLHADQHIEVELNLDEMDLTTAESKATYDEIKEYVLENTGLKVSQLYIAQIKRKYGIIERANYNLPKSENTKVPNCPPDKETAIVDALRHFGMIKNNADV